MRPFILFFILIVASVRLSAQRLVTAKEAQDLALNNQRNLKAANLTVQQQQELLRGAAGLESPQVFGESTPYEPLIVGVQQSFSLPSVYRNRKALQEEQLRLARLQLQGSEYELKLAVAQRYLQLQFLSERQRLVLYQDSIFRAIKTAAKRFFEAGQIDKLEELQASAQADQVSNELQRVQMELAGELQVFGFYTGLNDTFQVERFATNVFLPSDTFVSNVQQQILQQQVLIGEKELKLQRSQLLPEFQAGVSFPTSGGYEKPIGYQFGITIPIWQRQNRARVAAAKTGIEIARAQQELQSQQLRADYRQALANYQRDLQSLGYYNQTALPQARAIVETSRRLFEAGQLNYIESLRNLQSAFDIYFAHLDTHRSFNESVIRLKYLNGSL